jgi:hypothetical protein
MGPVRVVVTRIERDGAMHRRMVDTAQQSDPRNWEALAARALATRPPYRPVPGTAVYHLCVDGNIIQVGEYDLQGPLRDLVIVVLAIGSTMLAAPSGRLRDELVVHTFPAGRPTRRGSRESTTGLAEGAPLPSSVNEAASPPARPMGHRSLFTVARAMRQPPGAGCGGGLPISSMRPSTTSSKTAITMVTAAVGRPQKTKIKAASVTAPMRSPCRCA